MRFPFFIKRNNKERPAEIQYVGGHGVSRTCAEAVMRLFQFGDRISQAKVLTYGSNHCLLLAVNEHELVAVKSGFTSGYPGEGPRTFSFVLSLLAAHKVDIDEYDVSEDVIGRVNRSLLTIADLQKLEVAPPIRPSRWYDYVWDIHWETWRRGELFQNFPPVIPLAIVDSRLVDLTMSFFERPDDCLLTGYRRLEDIVRNRTGLQEHGAKLFSQAFYGEKAKLVWEDVDGSGQNARASLFTGTYMAYRNLRAHRELDRTADTHLNEFLLLNHLYTLEKQAREAVQG